MKTRMLRGALIALGGLISMSISATELPDQFKADDAISGSNKALGQIEKFVELRDKWIFVQGSKDTFLMTENGRFAITVEDGVLSLSDIWQQKALAFSELDKARFTFPMDSLGFMPGGSKAPGMHFVLGDGPVKATLFGDPLSEKMRSFVAGIDWSSAGFSVNYYPLPQSKESWLRFACANRAVQQAVVSGEKLELPDVGSSCDQREALRSAGSLAGIGKVLGVKSYPFAIRHSDWDGGPAKKRFVEYVKQ